MEMQKSAALPPSYRQILEEAGRLLSDRKSLFSKRVIILFLPPSIIYGLLYFLGSFIHERIRDTYPEVFKLLIIIFPIIAFTTIIYVFIVGKIFSIEKLVWIDSYFDKKNLDGKQSWKIARKLFIPMILLQTRILIKYYLLPTFIFGLFFVGAFFLTFISNLRAKFGDSYALFPLYAVIIGGGFFVYYIYILRTKLRYSLFLFLDMYQGKSFSYRDYFQNLEELNLISKSETFKKALIVNIGTDIAESIFQITIDGIAAGFAKTGKVGDSVSQTGKAFAGEATHQVIEFGKMASFYILYRYARKQLYGEEQHINEKIYKLAEVEG